MVVCVEEGEREGEREREERERRDGQHTRAPVQEGRDDDGGKHQRCVERESGPRERGSKMNRGGRAGEKC